MHRKRGSLEQGLVTPPPRPSANFDFRFHKTHASASPPQTPRFFPLDDASGCGSRVPFSSLAAFLLCLFGVLLFTIMALWAFNASVEQFRRALRVDNLPWLDKVQLLFIISACAMVVISLAFLCIGVLSTGPTRQSVFSGRAEARRGGRISCVLAICLSMALNLLWTLIAVFTAILAFVYAVLYQLCSSTPSPNNACLDFGVFKPLFGGQWSDASLRFCEGELQQFCAVSNTVIVWYFVGLLGALIVCIGLVQFIACNASNYAHIGSESKYAELRDIFYSELGLPMSQFNTDQQQQIINERRRLKFDQQQMVDYNPMGGGGDHTYQPHFDYRRSHQHPRSSSEKRSIGAMLGSARRNSYQHSLHGSNNWLNNVDGGGGMMHDQPIGRVMY